MLCVISYKNSFDIYSYFAKKCTIRFQEKSGQYTFSFEFRILTDKIIYCRNISQEVLKLGTRLFMLNVDPIAGLFNKGLSNIDHFFLHVVT